jgi:hypothetical protein
METMIAAPRGTITIAGALNKIGNTILAPWKTPYTVGADGEYAVVFDSKKQTQINNGKSGGLYIPNLVVRPNTQLRTNSSFNINNLLYVMDGADMRCESGEITFDGADIMGIINISSTTLVINDMLVRGRLETG